MPVDPEFKRAIEQVKLRAPIEEVVRERVAELRKRGRLWEACCPFHEERTPSFKVDPRRGTWHCYGACQRGGDVISFVQESQNLSFRDALELLAARTGVDLPRPRGSAVSGDDPGLAVLAGADAFFQAQLAGGEGRAARGYLERRGLSANTVAAFGLGWAPQSGATLVGFARREGRERREGGDLAIWERAGLVRRGDDGHPYAFFRGRLMIPIRDVRGRTVGFGARRLEDGEGSGPKYINTPETPWFHKGRVIYGLDRGIDAVRRNGHLVLVEGYTDVMAAHQVGLSTVCAVLGTATTEDHAALVRRAGARRVSLVFDGDEAGRAAAWRALEGLLPLELDLDVVVLPAGQDPADLLGSGGAEALQARLEVATHWFEFLVEGLEGLEGRELSRAVDRTLGLVGRLAKPVHRDSVVRRLAQGLDLPVETLREQWRALPGRRSPQTPSQTPSQTAVQGAPAPSAAPKKPVDRRVLEAYKAAVAAALSDPGLVPRVRPLVERCPSEPLTAVLRALLELFEDEDATIDASSVMTALGEHPVRAHVLSLLEHARTSDYPPHQLLDESLRFLAAREEAAAKRVLQRRIAELQEGADCGDAEAARELERARERLNDLHKAGGKIGAT